MAITVAMELKYSPVTLGAMARGTNARIVVSVEVSSGSARVLPALMAASLLSSPSSMRLPTSSAITMPLSTKSPRDMIRVAKVIRWSSRPKTRIQTRVTIMVRGTMVPTMSPVRNPRKSITTASTVTKVCTRFMATPLIDSATYFA